MAEKVYYETGRPNSGNYARFYTKREAMKFAQRIADEFQENVTVDKRTEDDPIDSFEVKPRKQK